MRSARWFGIGAFGAALAVAAPARADIASAYAQLELGYAGGKGISGARQDESFHAGAQGVAYGMLVGAEVLFVDVWVQHDQYRDGSRLAGTWTQFMLGFDVEIDLGDEKGAVLDDKGNTSGGRGFSSAYAEIGTGFGFGVGTGRQVDPPLDNSEVTDKGFLLQGCFGIGYRLTRYLSVGVSVPVQAGYLVKSGAGEVVNDDNNGYFEFNAALMANARVKFQLK